MAENFDPYQQWLGIDPEDHPADHYQILGVPQFESDVQKIASAADERMSLVRSFQTGRRGKYTQRILNELAAAKVCLTTPTTKAAYDGDLKRQLAVSLSGVFPELPPGAELPPPTTAGGAQAPFAWNNPTPQTAPAMPPPVMPPAGYAQPGAQHPMYGAPVYGAPVFNAPTFNAPAYGAPAYNVPLQNPPVPPYATPGYPIPYPTAIPTAIPVAAPVANPVARSYSAPVVPPPPPPQPRANVVPPQPTVSPPPPPIVVTTTKPTKKPTDASAPKKNPTTTTPPASTPAPTPAPSATMRVEGAEENEEQISLFARPWFPAAVVGGVVLVVAAVWLVRAWRTPSALNEAVAEENAVEQTVDSTEETPAENAARQTASKQVETVISQEGDSGVNFPPQLAVIHGSKAELQVRGEEYLIGNWVATEDHLTWRFHVVKPNVFKAQLIYLAADDAVGGQYGIAVDGEERTGDIRASDPPGQFVTDEIFIAVKRPGEHRLTLRPIHKPGSEFMTLKSLRFSPYNSGKDKPQEPSEQN